MAFWGVEVKPGKPYSHRFDTNGGRLHISQATLGIGKAKERSLVQCNVGDKSPIFLCSLTPQTAESCTLNLEFAEYDEVIFSVLGPRSVHLAGYYLDKGANFDGDDEYDSYGEDIEESGSENDQSTDFDTEDEYEDDFIDDDEDDIDMFPPSPRPNRGVVIEEILDDENPPNGNGVRRSLKKKHQMSVSDGDNQKQIILGGSSMFDSETEDEDGLPVPEPDKKVSKGSKKKSKSGRGSSMFDSDTEDEDGLPVPSLSKTKDESAEVKEKPGKKVSKGSKKKSKSGGDQVIGAKRKSQDIHDDEIERGIEDPNDSSIQSSKDGQENPEKPKKKKKKERTRGAGHDNMVDVQKEDKARMEEAKTDDNTQEEPVRVLAEEKPSNDNVEIDAAHVAEEDTTGKKKKKKKKNKKNKTPESDNAAITEAKESVVETEKKKAKVKATYERNYPNGLVVEDLEMGKPDGKRASPGKKVSVHYIGKLQKNGKIFDSNIGRAPFMFRLGVGQVIKGWDVGVHGMRVGDKRRLTIPPSMGYGSRATGAIPANSWLVFDVTLEDVR